MNKKDWHNKEKLAEWFRKLGPEKTFSKKLKKSFRFAGLHPALSKSASQICRVDGKLYFPYNEKRLEIAYQIEMLRRGAKIVKIRENI